MGKARFFTFTLLFCFSFLAHGQCWNTINPSCDVYETCFNRYCRCEGSGFEYSLSFGKTYCNAFLGESELTPEGKKWRDSTLRCLQEVLVPLIPIEANPSCNCEELKKFAYGSHVACYTQEGASVCDLPSSDITKIAKTIIFNKNIINTLKDYKEGYQQVKGVFSKCSTTAKEVKTRKKWKFYLKLLTGKVGS